MKLYKDFNISINHKKSIILIGNFDGVHLGHQKLFKLANTYKKKFKKIWLFGANLLGVRGSVYVTMWGQTTGTYPMYYINDIILIKKPLSSHVYCHISVLWWNC